MSVEKLSFEFLNFRAKNVIKFILRHSRHFSNTMESIFQEAYGIRLHVLQHCHVVPDLFSSEHTNVTKCWGVLKPYRESWQQQCT